MNMPAIGNVTEPPTVEPVKPPPLTPVVRLSINLAPDVAAALKRWCTQKGVSITEGVRRAIVVWNFLETERAQGHRLAVIEPGPNGEEKIREIVLVA